MLVDLVGQLNRRYLATAFSSLVGSLTSCRTGQTNRWAKVPLGPVSKYCRSSSMRLQHWSTCQQGGEVGASARWKPVLLYPVRLAGLDNMRKTRAVKQAFVLKRGQAHQPHSLVTRDPAQKAPSHRVNDLPMNICCSGLTAIVYKRQVSCDPHEQQYWFFLKD